MNLPLPLASFCTAMPCGKLVVMPPTIVAAQPPATFTGGLITVGSAVPSDGAQCATSVNSDTPFPPNSSMYKSSVPVALWKIPIPNRTPFRLSVTFDTVSIDCAATGWSTLLIRSIFCDRSKPTYKAVHAVPAVFAPTV